MRTVNISLACVLAVAAGGCSNKKDPMKEKLSPSCESLLKMRDRCVVEKLQPTEEAKFLDACKLAEKVVPDVGRQVQCVKEVDCDKFKACYQAGPESAARWKLAHTWVENAAKDAKVNDNNNRIDWCEKWSEDKTGVVAALCKPWVAEHWPKLVAENEKKLDEMWEKNGSPTDTSVLGNLAKLIGKDKEAEPLVSGIEQMNQMRGEWNKARITVDRNKQYQSRLPTECGLRRFKGEYAKHEDPRVKKYVASYARWCFVTVGAQVLEYVAKKKDPCSGREDVADGVEHFKLTDPKLDAALKLDAGRCK